MGNSDPWPSHPSRPLVHSFGTRPPVAPGAVVVVGGHARCKCRSAKVRFGHWLEGKGGSAMEHISRHCVSRAPAVALLLRGDVLECQSPIPTSERILSERHAGKWPTLQMPGVAGGRARGRGVVSGMQMLGQRLLGMRRLQLQHLGSLRVQRWSRGLWPWSRRRRPPSPFPLGPSQLACIARIQHTIRTG